MAAFSAIISPLRFLNFFLHGPPLRADMFFREGDNLFHLGEGTLIGEKWILVISFLCQWVNLGKRQVMHCWLMRHQRSLLEVGWIELGPRKVFSSG